MCANTQRAHLFGTETQTAQPIRTLPVLKGREERWQREKQRGRGVDGWWLVGESVRASERGRERERVGGVVCGAGRRHVISQIDKFQSSAKAKSRGY